MGAQMRTRGLDWLALAGCVIAFVVAVLPTYKVEFMASPLRWRAQAKSARLTAPRSR